MWRDEEIAAGDSGIEFLLDAPAQRLRGVLVAKAKEETGIDRASRKVPSTKMTPPLEPSLVVDGFPQ
jgi:hypothetical protein